MVGLPPPQGTRSTKDEPVTGEGASLPNEGDPKVATKPAKQEQATQEVEFYERNLPPAVRTMIDTVRSGIEVGDTIEVTVDILDRILSAQTAEEVFAGMGGLTAAKDIQGDPIEILSVDWRPSDYKGETAVGFYAVFEVRNLIEDEKQTVGCGSLNIMAQLFSLNRLGALPFAAVITQTDKPTDSGYYPMFLRPMTDLDYERSKVSPSEEAAETPL